MGVVASFGITSSDDVRPAATVATVPSGAKAGTVNAANPTTTAPHTRPTMTLADGFMVSSMPGGVVERHCLGAWFVRCSRRAGHRGHHARV